MVGEFFLVVRGIRSFEVGIFVGEVMKNFMSVILKWGGGMIVEGGVLDVDVTKL